MLDIAKLNAFVVVVEESNISKAAVRLNMQQPPLTRLIKSLEDELGVLLFNRLPRGVETTQAGQVLYQEARSILSHAQSIQQRLSYIAKGMEGQLRIGFTNSAGLHAFLPTLLAQYRALYPAVNIHLEEHGSRALTEAILNQKLDIAFLRKPAAEGLGLTSIHLFDEPLMVALPIDHPLAEMQESIDMADLAQDDFVLYRRLNGQDLYDHILSLCLQAGFRPRIIQETPRLTLSLNLIAAGIGISIVPQSIQHFWNKQIIYKAIHAENSCNAPVYAIYSDAKENIYVQHILELLKTISTN